MKLASIGKSALVVLGVGYSLTRAVRTLSAKQITTRRLAEAEERLASLEAVLPRTTESPQPGAAENPERFVTEAELNSAVSEAMVETLDRVYTRMDAELRRRFTVQEQSVEALRAMISQTDELLERVLEGLETTRQENQMALDR